MRRSTGHFLTAAACLVFAGYAASFLYFFVDDEAIPLVYARNLLRGRGLVYTVLEGRVEGYSDFLHVLWSAVLLALTHAFGLPLLAPLLIGKLVSVAAAFGVIAVTARTLRSQQVAALLVLGSVRIAHGCIAKLNAGVGAQVTRRGDRRNRAR